MELVVNIKHYDPLVPVNEKKINFFTATRHSK